MSTETIVTLINHYGYLAIVFLIALENIFPPIPSEVILTFTGFLTLTTGLSVWGAIVASTVGSVLGAVLLYGFGRLMTVERLSRFLETRTGRLLRLKPKDVQKASNFFHRHGGKAILYGRFVPVVRSLISIPAGMTRFPIWLFIGLSTLGTMIWNTVLINAGCLAGNHWTDVLAWFEQASTVLLIIVVLVALIAGIVYRYRRKQRRLGE
ncbi:alkaline phosphatase [Secundilactobacillus odoratitofui DSM 19909 = JCM 15043]|uniref:Alkaline phosphatase n=1 Tax=Secundilactobacillus odoratitofui DSM 19909 = JCM 15043 TaxID=1423776 RepID=A0A0R1LVP4_9LACO|nr:DedA family protein [Secundilactobacillus odoratitofui]KRK99845.1 alkaline phosphatase [Secundilactobacillus odoratitofui DSM 19909 = JCM 15043]